MFNYEYYLVIVATAIAFWSVCALAFIVYLWRLFKTVPKDVWRLYGNR
jgi:hypothetical protein